MKIWRLKNVNLDGQTINVEGLAASVTDVLLRVNLPKDQGFNAVIRPADPAYKLDLSGPKGIAVPGYLRMGIEHILTASTICCSCSACSCWSGRAGGW